jgi:hypothetical protein
MATPDQIVGRASVETLRFTAGGINNQRAGSGWLIALTPQRAAILEGRACSKAALALGAPRAALGATAAAAAPLKTRAKIASPALRTGAIRTRALASGTIRTPAVAT